MKLQNKDWIRIYGGLTAIANVPIADFKGNYALGTRTLTPLVVFKDVFDKTVKTMTSQEDIRKAHEEETEIDVWKVKTSFLQKAPADKITSAILTDIRELIDDDANILDEKQNKKE